MRLRRLKMYNPHTNETTITATDKNEMIRLLEEAMGSEGSRADAEAEFRELDAAGYIEFDGVEFTLTR